MVLIYSATKGLARDDSRARTLARLARLRRTRGHVLAGASHSRARMRFNGPPSSLRIRPACSPSTKPVDRAIVADLESPCGSCSPVRDQHGHPERARPTTPLQPWVFTRASSCGRIDPGHRSVGQFFPGRGRHATRPDVYIRSAGSRFPIPRLATIAPPRVSRDGEKAFPFGWRWLRSVISRISIVRSW
jgi:hypothetical protein